MPKSIRRHLVKLLCGRLGFQESRLACEQEVRERWLVETNASTLVNDVFGEERSADCLTKQRLSNRFVIHGTVIGTANLGIVDISKTYIYSVVPGLIFVENV